MGSIEPLVAQYLNWIGGVARGDFGTLVDRRHVDLAHDRRHIAGHA